MNLFICSNVAQPSQKRSSLYFKAEVSEMLGGKCEGLQAEEKDS